MDGETTAGADRVESCVAGLRPAGEVAGFKAAIGQQIAGRNANRRVLGDDAGGDGSRGLEHRVMIGIGERHHDILIGGGVAVADRDRIALRDRGLRRDRLRQQGVAHRIAPGHGAGGTIGRVGAEGRREGADIADAAVIGSRRNGVGIAVVGVREGDGAGGAFDAGDLRHGDVVEQPVEMAV
jgi:hypothetical protein